MDTRTDTAGESLDASLVEQFVAIVGAANALREAGDVARYLSEPRDQFRAVSDLVLRPGTTEEVAEIVRLCARTGTPIVPQGGNTGLVGGQSPRSAGEIVLSLERMNRIREVDTVGRTMTVDAGVVLQVAQNAAAAAGLFFPLSLGAKGSCQIGGNLSSNAGGTGALAYGTARDLCLGIEAVMASGDVVHGLRRLKKDNRGYDLRDLLIGAEGTLGIVTGAVLKLFPAAVGREVAYAGVASPEAALELLQIAERRTAGALTAFELIPRIGIAFSLRHTENVRDPLAEPHDWYCLVEVVSQRSAEDAANLMQDVLEAGFEAGIVSDAAIAKSLAESEAFWRLREEMSWALKPEGGCIKHDVAVPVASVPTFLARADAAVRDLVPAARIVAFGHLGDGNIHYDISQPEDWDRQAFMAYESRVHAQVYRIVADLDGTFSAEHGIGQLKREELAEAKAGAEIDAMRAIKKALDPQSILNPGKTI